MFWQLHLQVFVVLCNLVRMLNWTLYSITPFILTPFPILRGDNFYQLIFPILPFYLLLVCFLQWTWIREFLALPHSGFDRQTASEPAICFTQHFNLLDYSLSYKDKSRPLKAMTSSSCSVTPLGTLPYFSKYHFALFPKQSFQIIWQLTWCILHLFDILKRFSCNFSLGKNQKSQGAKSEL